MNDEELHFLLNQMKEEIKRDRKDFNRLFAEEKELHIKEIQSLKKINKSIREQNIALRKELLAIKKVQELRDLLRLDLDDSN